MAGDVQQPFSLSFQVDALHSSSISFGRFELESLSWERRSSFSHNRYLEEVEKYARPGSVTEKKAYFEAHFRKRALLRQASSVSQAEIERPNSDSSSYGTSTCEENHRDLIHGEEPEQMVENGNLCCFDESPKGSSHDRDSGFFEYETGLAYNLHSQSLTESLSSLDDTSIKCSSLVGDFCGGKHGNNATATDSLELQLEVTQDALCSVKSVKCNGNADSRESESTLYQDSMFIVQLNVNLESESNDQTPNVLKEQYISESAAGKMINQPSEVHTLPRIWKAADNTRSSGLGSRPDGDISLSCEHEGKKGSSRTNGWREKQSPLTAKGKKQMLKSTAPSLQSSLRQLKENPQNLKPKSPHANRSEKELRPKRAVTPQPSTPERSESRRHRSMTSTRQIVSTMRENSKSVMDTSFSCSRGAEKRREKIMAADIRESSRKPDLKEKQKLCSISNNVSRISNREKSQVVPSTRLSAKSTRTLQSENRTRTTSKPCSTSTVKQVVSPNISHFSSSLDRGSDIHKIIDTNGSSRTRNRVMEANQRKEVVIRKEGANDRKPKARENGQITKEKLLEATQKVELGRSGHSFLRNHAVAITATPKVGPGRIGIGNSLLRKSNGH